jgi:GrpB-like predicted nucleotidyltransferase (UPF0157 family)
MNSLIEKYTPTWINHFADIKREIDNGLQGLDYSIEHVGSTAVPNLDSKPIPEWRRDIKPPPNGADR